MDGMKDSLNTLLISTEVLILTALSASKKAAALSALLIMLTKPRSLLKSATDTNA